jgi:hypothetical protein
MDLDRIPERDVDRQRVRCIVVGNAEDGAPESAYFYDDVSDEGVEG